MGSVPDNKEGTREGREHSLRIYASYPRWPMFDTSTYEEVLRTAARATPRPVSYVSFRPSVLILPARSRSAE